MGCRRRHAQAQVALGWPLPCGFLAAVPSSPQRRFAPTSLSPDSWQWGRATAASSRVPVSSPLQAWPLQSSCVVEGTSLGSGPRPAVRAAAQPHPHLAPAGRRCWCLPWPPSAPGQGRIFLSSPGRCGQAVLA